MKTKELIRRLQEADPSGERECCVDNADIYYVETQPAYYDGRLEVLVHDESRRNKSYSIVGAKRVASGDKVRIITLSIEDAISDNEDLPIEYVGMDKADEEHYRVIDEGYRKEIREIRTKIETEHFQSWVLKTLKNKLQEDNIQANWQDDRLARKVYSVAKDFFDRNLSYKDILPIIEPKKRKDGWLEYPSYNDRREKYWSECVNIEYNILTSEVRVYFYDNPSQTKYYNSLC